MDFYRKVLSFFVTLRSYKRYLFLAFHNQTKKKRAKKCNQEYHYHEITLQVNHSESKRVQTYAVQYLDIKLRLTYATFNINGCIIRNCMLQVKKR